MARSSRSVWWWWSVIVLVCALVQMQVSGSPLNFRRDDDDDDDKSRAPVTVQQTVPLTVQQTIINTVDSRVTVTLGGAPPVTVEKPAATIVSTIFGNPPPAATVIVQETVPAGPPSTATVTLTNAVTVSNVLTETVVQPTTVLQMETLVQQVFVTVSAEGSGAGDGKVSAEQQTSEGGAEGAEGAEGGHSKPVEAGSQTAGSAEGIEGGEAKEEHELLETALPFLYWALGFGCLIQWGLTLLPAILALPYTVLLFLMGLAVAAIEDKVSLGVFAEGVREMRKIEPEVILLLVLPPLLYEGASAMDFHVFGKVAVSSIILAGPGVVVGALMTAPYFMFVGNYGWNFSFAMMVGSILSTTDPVAVVQTLNSLGAPARLNSLIDGEALLNDGSGFVMFLLFLDFAAGENKTAADSVITLIRLAVGGPIAGLVFAMITVMFIKRVFNDPVVEAGALIIMVYTTFYICEIVLKVSSVLAVVCFGLYMAYDGKYSFSPEVEHHVHSVIGQIGYWANTFIFVVAGVLVYDAWSTPGVLNGKNIGVLIGLYVALTLIRFLAIMMFYPILTRIGYGLDFKDVGLLVYGGLRGAVAIILAVLVNIDDRFANRPTDRALVAFHVSGIALLTTLINGSTTKWFYEKLNIDPPNPQYGTLVRNALGNVEAETREIGEKLELDWFYKYADWEIIWNIVPDLRNISIKGRVIKFHDAGTPLGAEESDGTATLKNSLSTLGRNNVSARQFRLSTFIPSSDPSARQSRMSYYASGVNPLAGGGGDNRRSTWMIGASTSDATQMVTTTFLNGLWAHNQSRFEEGYLTPAALQILKKAADLARESPETGASKLLHGWKAMEKILPELTPATSYIPGFILNRLLSTRVAAVVESVAGFIHAHEVVYEQLEHRLGPNLCLPLKSPIHTATTLAKRYLQATFQQHPSLVREVQTLQVSRYLLHAKRELVEEFLEEGLLDSKAGNQVIEELEKRLRYLRWWRPTVEGRLG
ncbi:Sodium/hydrogen exchanger family-domain-containing protein [Gaertneriomyces semiglobifer]|nr:Sodium/hydrogen exchanger family-domain-containing protein [Gaertneriomyces semiglobifer]